MLCSDPLTVSTLIIVSDHFGSGKSFYSYVMKSFIYPEENKNNITSKDGTMVKIGE